MDIFNRKKLAAAEAEIERLEKACAKFHTDINEAENKAERYKRERDEARSNIGKQVAQNGELTKSLSELRYLKGQKEKDEQALKSEIEELNNKLKEAEVTNSALKLCLEQSEDIEVIEDDNRTENAAYIIRNELVEGKICDNKKTRYKFVSSLYKSCKSLFSQSELKFYEMLSDLAQKKGLILFSKVRLADIIEMWEKFYDEKSMEKAIKQNAYEKGTAFLNALNKNSFKRQVYDRIQKLNPDFNDRDYRTAFLYPLLRLHIDFLLCKKIENNVVPLMAIELNGEEHYKDWKKINNDNFKKSVFFSDYVYIGFLSVYNDVLNNEEDKLRKILSDVIDDLSNKEMLNTWKGIQNTLNNLAKPYMEKLGK